MEWRRIYFSKIEHLKLLSSEILCVLRKVLEAAVLSYVYLNCSFTLGRVK